MKFKIITPKGSEIEMELGQEVVLSLDEKKIVISIKETE